MLTIFLCFLICFLPLMLVNVVDDSVAFPFLHILASVLAWASAVVNPFIYAFKNRQYQQAFIKVLNCSSFTSSKPGNMISCSKVRQQIFCCKLQSTSSNGAQTRGEAGNISKESRTSASKTFLTDMLHFSSATDKVSYRKLFQALHFIPSFLCYSQNML